MEQGGSSSILFRSDNGTAFLVDIPTSFQIALYGTHSSSKPLKIPYAMSARHVPYPSTDPLPGSLRGPTQHFHRGPETCDICRECLESLRPWLGSQPWCLSRSFTDSEEVDNALKTQMIGVDTHILQPWSASALSLLPAGGKIFARISDIQDLIICNPHGCIAELRIHASGLKFYVPPFSKFLLSTISEESIINFSMTALQLYPDESSATAAGPAQFDMVILDPPWPNRSVKRRSNFRVLELDNDPVGALKPILSQHIAPHGFVACWVTNKVSVWQQVEDLYREWELDIVEEWLWLKVTTEGQPVMDLQSPWRRPYETLLIGKKRLSSDSCDLASNVTDDRRKRVIAAVPDHHSRKPNLKEFLEELLFCGHTNYRGLEIFARSLTADWLAWGDEVLKFNNSVAWRPEFDPLNEHDTSALQSQAIGVAN